MNTNERLKLLRKKELNITQDEMAAVLGLQRSSYCMIENGHRQLRENHIKILSAHYNVNEFWLKNGTGSVFNSSPYRKQFMTMFETFEPPVQRYFLKMMNDYIELREEESHM